jgi:hypothetical protein
MASRVREVSGKLAHIFQYAMNATIAADASGPLVEFISKPWPCSSPTCCSSATPAAKRWRTSTPSRRSFAFQAPVVAAPESEAAPAETAEAVPAPRRWRSKIFRRIATFPEILEFFVPEAEEHSAGGHRVLLALEANPNSEDINRLFRAMHTIKGSAAQGAYSASRWSRTAPRT